MEKPLWGCRSGIRPRKRLSAGDVNKSSRGNLQLGPCSLQRPSCKP